MLQHLDLRDILFFDIETVSCTEHYEHLPERLQELWHKKAAQLLKQPVTELSEEDASDFYRNRAAIYAEFGRIVCISVGIVRRDESGLYTVRLKSFADENEYKLLEDFADLLRTHYNDDRKHSLCGHNIKEFDVPYICRKMVLHKIELPKLLDIPGKKPWETKFVDTLELWKFGDNKAYTSLNLLTAIFDIPSPKDDIDGSQVHGVFFEDQDLPRIAQYCENDVLATIRLLMRWKYLPDLPDESAIRVAY